MARLFLIVLLSLCAQGSVAVAQITPAQCKPNGCGPDGWLGVLVPDTPVGCDFTAACDQHDICYGRCIAGCSPIAGTSACDGDCKARRPEKEKCDSAFVKKMKADNPGRWICEKVADDYYWFVSNCGCGFFRGFVGNIAVMTKAERDQHRRSFEELARFRAFMRTHPGNPRGLQIEWGLELMRYFGYCNDNRFRFHVDGDTPVLAIESRLHIEVPSIKTDKGYELRSRRIFSGIDVTKMLVNGKRFDLNELAPMIAPEQLKNVQQIEQFQ